MSADLTSDLLRTLVARGYLHQCTDLAALDRLAASGPITGYIGFDLTADSLHIGHLVSIMMLRTMAHSGHRPIALVGGGTTKVGDPSFKDEARPLLDDARIEHNKAGIKNTLGRFLDFGDAPGQARLVDNDEWLSKLGYIALLRDVGRHFTINRMLSFDSVRLRLEREQPLTFLEFNYMIMQAFDFAELSRRFDCRLQLGGSDQWGNIVNGVELTRRLHQREVFGFTTPLITTASGAKMGKTAAGAVWLNPDKLSTFDYYQFWRNTEDADVGRFLRLFTELPLDEIARLETLRDAEINEAKERLAFEATALNHGTAAAGEARTTARALYGGAGDDLDALPVIEVDGARMIEGVGVLDLMVQTGLAESKGAARRLIRGGGVRVNDARLEDETFIVIEDTLKDGAVKLSSGKKRHVLVRAV